MIKRHKRGGVGDSCLNKKSKQNAGNLQSRLFILVLVLVLFIPLRSFLHIPMPIP